MRPPRIPIQTTFGRFLPLVVRPGSNRETDLGVILPPSVPPDLTGEDDDTTTPENPCGCLTANPLEDELLADNVVHWWRFREAVYDTTGAENYTPDVIEEPSRGTPSMGAHRMIFGIDGAGTLNEITELQSGPSTQSYSIKRTLGGHNPTNDWLGQAAIGNIATGNGDSFTIEAWFYLTVTGSYDLLNVSGATNDYLITNADGSLTLGRDGTTFNTAAGIVVEDEWRYVAIVVDGPGNTVKLYVNPAADLLPVIDETDPATSATDSFVLSVGSPNGAGGSGDAPDGAFEGYVTEVAIYDSALSAERIRVHYLSGYYGDDGVVPPGEQVTDLPVSSLRPGLEGQHLVTSASLAVWETQVLDDVSDVTITSVSAGDALTWSGTAWVNDSTLDAVARVGVRKNSTGSTFNRRRLNLIEGSNITLTVADDSGSEEVDITISAASSGSVALDDLTDVVITSVADNDLLVYDSGSGDWVNTAAISVSASATDVQTYDSGTPTWTKPTGAKAVRVICIGGGGSGGSGCNGNSTARAGGSGGGGGAVTVADFDADDLTGTVAVTVGAGGAAKAGTTTSAGTDGDNGGSSSFGSYVFAGGGGGGKGGGTSSQNGGGGGAQNASANFTSGGTGQGGATPLFAGDTNGGQGPNGASIGRRAEWGGGSGGGSGNAAAGAAGGPSIFGGPGGGGGGGCNASNTGFAGAGGGDNGWGALGGGGAGGGIGVAGTPGSSTPKPYCGTGGGGGGGTTGGAGKNGGDGGAPGAGGGGGGAGTGAGTAGGDSGAGGAGRVIVITYL